jgi:hypothetical protein
LKENLENTLGERENRLGFEDAEEATNRLGRALVTAREIREVLQG